MDDDILEIICLLKTLEETLSDLNLLLLFIIKKGELKWELN